MSDSVHTERSIGVVGAGTMGMGIAQVAAENGYKVHITDANLLALQSAKERLERLFARLVERGKRTEEQVQSTMQSMSFAAGIEELERCDLVIEAIVERLDVKKQVFSDLEEVVSENCVLATNTSSLSVAAVASACTRPQRVLGLHFFNPAPLMRLVEIVPCLQTADDVVNASRRLMESWGKTPVIASDTPGFIVNRVARPFYSEAIRIYEEGIAGFTAIDSSIRKLGFRMGPFELMDFIGNDVNYAVTRSVWEACHFEPRYKPSFTQLKLVESGRLGRKSGRGYYDYSKGDGRLEEEDSADLQEAIGRRIVTMLINEAADALFWGIATRDDIDLAMTRGVNYPKGLLKWADELTARVVVDHIDALYDEYREERYRCSPILRRMARGNETFYDN